MAWTDEQRKTIESLWRDGFSAAEIARVVDPSGATSRNAIVGVVHRMGLSGRDRVMRMRAAIKPPPPKTDKPAKPKRAPTPVEQFFRPIQESPGPKGGVKFLEIMSGQCRWPVGGRGLEDFRFCGATATRGSYCHEHHELSRGRGTRGEQEALSKIPA